MILQITSLSGLGILLQLYNIQMHEIVESCFGDNLVLYRLSLTGHCITIGRVSNNNRNSFPRKCGKSKTYAVGEVHLLANSV